MTWRIGPQRFAIAVASLLLTFAAPVRAEEPSAVAASNEARAVERYGVARERFDAGDLPGALEAIEESLSLLDSPNSDLLRGHILRGLGRRVDAIGVYERAFSGSKRRLLAGEARFEPTAAEAGRWMGVLGAELAEIDISVLGASPAAALSLGGRGVAMEASGGGSSAKVWMEPGEARIEVVDGARREVKRVAAPAGSSQRILFDLRPPVTTPSDAPSGLPPTAAWIGLGVGGAGLTAFGILGALALSADADLAGSCSPRCPPSRLDEAERGERLQVGANVAAVIGAAGLATGAIIWIVDAATSADPSPARPARAGRGLVWRF